MYMVTVLIQLSLDCIATYTMHICTSSRGTGICTCTPFTINRDRELIQYMWIICLLCAPSDSMHSSGQWLKQVSKLLQALSKVHHHMAVTAMKKAAKQAVPMKKPAGVEKVQKAKTSPLSLDDIKSKLDGYDPEEV